MIRYCLRRSALRLLSSSPSASYLAKSRSITTGSALTIRTRSPAQAPSTYLLRNQRRWASDDADKGLPTELDPDGGKGLPTELDADQTAANHGESSHVASAIESATETASTRGNEAAADAETTVNEAARSAASTVAETGSAAAESVAGTAEAVGAAAGLAAGDGSPSGSTTRKDTVYVGNIFFDVTKEDLVREFQRFGEVTEAKIVSDARGLSKGYVQLFFPRPIIPLSSNYATLAALPAPRGGPNSESREQHPNQSCRSDCHGDWSEYSGSTNPPLTPPHLSCNFD